MKRIRINWLTVIRNISFIALLTSSILANKQIHDNRIKLEEMSNELFENQDLVEVQNDYEAYNYITEEENSIVVEPDASKDNNKVYLGNFKITHYCACKKCCGPNAQGITASGKKVQEGKTIAVDPKVIKLGSQVYIDGYGEYEAQDTGSAIKGNIIDVYIADHNEALKLGVQYKDVYLIK